MCDLLFVSLGYCSCKQAQSWTCMSPLECPACGLPGCSQPTRAFAAAPDPAALTRGFQLWEMCPVPCLTPAPVRLEEWLSHPGSLPSHLTHFAPFGGYFRAPKASRAPHYECPIADKWIEETRNLKHFIPAVATRLTTPPEKLR